MLSSKQNKPWWTIFLLSLLTSSLGLVLSQSSSSTSSSTARPSRLAGLLDMKDRFMDRLCDSASRLLTSSLTSCGNATYCETLKTISENIPVGCGIANEGFNESVKRLAYCVRRRDRTCIEGLMQDMQEKYEQMRTMGELATGRRRRK